MCFTEKKTGEICVLQEKKLVKKCFTEKKTGIRCVLQEKNGENCVLLLKNWRKMCFTGKTLRISSTKARTPQPRGHSRLPARPTTLPKTLHLLTNIQTEMQYFRRRILTRINTHLDMYLDVIEPYPFGHVKIRKNTCVDAKHVIKPKLVVGHL